MVFDESFAGGASLAGQRDKSCYTCAPEEVQARGWARARMQAGVQVACS